MIVDALTLEAPGLSAGPGDPRAAALRPGRRAGSSPSWRAGDCTVDAGPPTAAVRLHDATGAVRDVTVPLEDDGLARRLHESDCFDKALLRQVAVEVVDVTEVAGPALQVTVRLRRVTGTDRLRVTRVDPNTVYDIKAVGGLPALDGRARSPASCA